MRTLLQSVAFLTCLVALIWLIRYDTKMAFMVSMWAILSVFAIIMYAYKAYFSERRDMIELQLDVVYAKMLGACIIAVIVLGWGVGLPASVAPRIMAGL